MKKQSLSWIGFGACALSVLGCSTDTDTATDADYDDVAQALGGVAATGNGGGEVGSMVDSVAIAVGTPTLGLTVDASGSFSGNRLGLTYDYQIACSDVAGTTLTACGPTTDSASVNVKWSGNLSTPMLSASVEREGDLSLTQVQSGTAIISGGSDLDIDAKFDSIFRNVSRAYHVSYSADYTELQVHLLPAQLVGGHVKYSLDVERLATTGKRKSEANFHMNGELAFASDGTATLTLDGQARYAVDTASGRVTRLSASASTSGY